jgi:uncharacterized membrane protein YeaQ/YmgE (transglycosylase-associated protein family)
MPHMDVIGWIVVGFIAGALSNSVVDRGGPGGCAGNTLIGILGGIIGGWFATVELHMDSTNGFLGALLVAFLGSVVVRLILDATAGDRYRERGDRR